MLAKLINLPATYSYERLNIIHGKEYRILFWADRDEVCFQNDLGMQISLPAMCFSLHDSIKIDRKSIPVLASTKLAEVGDLITNGKDALKDIIRIDTSTRQVWFKKGGFEWFEDMKNYQEV